MSKDNVRQVCAKVGVRVFSKTDLCGVELTIIKKKR